MGFKIGKKVIPHSLRFYRKSKVAVATTKALLFWLWRCGEQAKFLWLNQFIHYNTTYAHAT